MDVVFWKNILYGVEAIAGTAFSVFMMYAMWKTKKSAEKMVENVKELSEQVQQGVNVLTGASQVALLPTEEEVSEVVPFNPDPNHYIHNQNKIVE